LRPVVLVQNVRKLITPRIAKNGDSIVDLQSQKAAIGTDPTTPGETRDALTAAGIIQDDRIARPPMGLISISISTKQTKVMLEVVTYNLT